MKRPTISFIVPSYNYGRYIGDCLKSILSQDGAFRREIIVIDDASTDDSLEVIRSFQGLTAIVHQHNQGLLKTLNEGFARARGEFVARIDADDRYRPNFLRSSLAGFDSFPQAGLVYGNAALINEEGAISDEAPAPQHGDQPVVRNEYIHLMTQHHIASPTVMIRKSALDEILPLPATLTGSAMDDWYLELSLARRCRFVHIPEVLADYRVHSANLHSQSILRRLDEPIIISTLDALFADNEATHALELAKQDARDSAYATQYMTLARKYFGAGMLKDARRCYLRSVRHKPRNLIQIATLRHLFATFIGTRAYERLKAVRSSRWFRSIIGTRK